MADEKIAVYIDGGYTDAISDKLGIEINYEKFVVDICSKTKGELLRAYYYNCLPYKNDANPNPRDTERYSAKQAFLTAINRLPSFEVKKGRLDRHQFVCKKCKQKSLFTCPLCKHADYQYKQKLIDNLITVDIVSHSWRGLVDKIVLVAGDADFVPAIKEAKDAGVITHLYYASPNLGSFSHDEIKDVFDNRFEMTADYLKKFKI